MSEKDSPSRRDFLKRSTGVLAGTALAANLSVARAAHAEGSDEIKLGLIGCGGRGTKAVVDCFKADKNTKLVAVADAFADNAHRKLNWLMEKYAQRVDVPKDRVFDGFDAYQKVIDAGVDLVILATPPGFRPIHYKAAVEADKNVFMEKPICVDAPGYRSVIETNKLAEAKNLKVAVGLHLRHQKSRIEAVRRVRDGAIGELQFLRVFWNSAGVWNNRRKPGQTEMEYQMRNWYYFVWLCGDHIVEQHIHNIDVGNWIKGAHPIEAQGMGGREVRRFGPEGDFGHIFDHHFVEFTYPDGMKMFSQCRHIPKCWSNAAEYAHGTQGRAALEQRKRTIHDANDKRVYHFRGKEPEPHYQEQVDLIRAIRNGEKYHEGHIGAEANFTAILGRMATYSGQVVRWEDAAAGTRDEMPDRFAWNADPPVLPDENGSYEHAVPIPGRYKPY